MKCMWVTTICLVGLLIGDVRAQPTPAEPYSSFWHYGDKSVVMGGNSVAVARN